MRRTGLNLITSLLLPASLAIAAQQPAITVKQVVFTTSTLPAADRDFVQQAMQARLCPKDKAESCVTNDIRGALRQIGYIKAEVKIEKLDFPSKDRPQDVVITASVIPGTSYILKDVQIKGADSLSFLEKYRLPKPKAGERLNANDVNRLIAALLRAYSEKGHPDATAVPELLFDEARKEVTLIFIVDEGKLVPPRK